LADNSATIGLFVIVVDTNSTTPPPPPFDISAPTEVASLDYMTIPVTLDGQGQQIGSATLLYDPQTGGVVGGAPRLSAPRGPITNLSTDLPYSTGTFSPPLTGTSTYYKGNIIVPASVYRNGGVNYVLQVNMKSGKTFYEGLKGGAKWVSDTAAGLTPFSTPFIPLYEAPMTSTGGVVALADGGPTVGSTRITFPAGAVSGNSSVYIEQLDPADTARVPRPNGGAGPVAAYEFEASVRQFNKPIELTLRYLDVTGPKGIPDGVVDGTTIDASTLRVFWWDGFAWRLIGGEVDLVNHTVTAKTSHFSTYALFPSAGSEPVAAAYRPLEKLITPNGDGINDFADFSGLSSEKDFEIRIFDVTGRRIRTIRDTELWDGKDDNGRIVENGVYIYQYRADSSSEWISGMIGVAK